MIHLYWHFSNEEIVLLSFFIYEIEAGNKSNFIEECSAYIKFAIRLNFRLTCIQWIMFHISFHIINIYRKLKYLTNGISIWIYMTKIMSIKYNLLFIELIIMSFILLNKMKIFFFKQHECFVETIIHISFLKYIKKWQA